MIGIRTWERWPWPTMRIFLQVHNRRCYRKSHPDIADPYLEWRDHGDPVG